MHLPVHTCTYSFCSSMYTVGLEFLNALTLILLLIINQATSTSVFCPWLKNEWCDVWMFPVFFFLPKGSDKDRWPTFWMGIWWWCPETGSPDFVTRHWSARQNSSARLGEKTSVYRGRENWTIPLQAVRRTYAPQYQSVDSASHATRKPLNSSAAIALWTRRNTHAQAPPVEASLTNLL
jgi:hypothetical protein